MSVCVPLHRLQRRERGSVMTALEPSYSVTPFTIHISFYASFSLSQLSQAVGCCQDYVSKLAEFHSQWQRVKDGVGWEKLRGGKVDIHTGYLSCRVAKNVTHRCRNPLFGLAFQRNIIFLETLPDHLQSSFSLIISRRLTSVPKTATLWYTHKNSNFKLSNLGFFWDYYQQLWRNCRFPEMSSPSLFLCGCVHVVRGISVVLT